MPSGKYFKINECAPLISPLYNFSTTSSKCCPFSSHITSKNVISFSGNLADFQVLNLTKFSKSGPPFLTAADTVGPILPTPFTVPPPGTNANPVNR